MDTIDQEALLCTLKRIDRSLNKRYERNAALYISPQDTEVIKKHLYRQQFPAVLDMVRAGRQTAAIVARVVSRNLWLIDNDQDALWSFLPPILKDCDPVFLREILEAMQENRLEASSQIKQIYLSVYYSMAPAEECLRCLQSGNVVPSVANVCLGSMVQAAADSREMKEAIRSAVTAAPLLRDHPNALKAVFKKMTEEKRAALREAVTGLMKEQVQKKNDVDKLLYITLFTNYPKETSLCCLKDLGQNIGKRINVNLEQWKAVCNQFRAFYQGLLKEKEAQEAAKQMAAYYTEVERYPLGRKCAQQFAKKVFTFAGYSEWSKRYLMEAVQSLPGGSEILERFQETEEVAFSSAGDVYRYLQEEPWNGPKWHSWISTIIVKGVSGREDADQILTALLEDYSGQDCAAEAIHYPQIYQKLIVKRKSLMDPLFAFFSRHAQAKPPMDTADIYRERTIGKVRDAVIQTVVEKHITTGGRQGELYIYLHDFELEICKKLFDI